MRASSTPVDSANLEMEVGEETPTLTISATDFAEHATHERERQRAKREPSVELSHRRSPTNNDNTSRQTNGDADTRTCDCHDILGEVVTQIGSHLDDRKTQFPCGSRRCYSITDTLKDIIAFTARLPSPHHVGSTIEERLSQNVRSLGSLRSQSLPAWAVSVSGSEEGTRPSGSERARSVPTEIQARRENEILRQPNARRGPVQTDSSDEEEEDGWSVQARRSDMSCTGSVECPGHSPRLVKVDSRNT